MSYLSHDERRKMILETAVKIAFTEGLGAMTVRRVAQEAQIAVGQIHRHFASASDLKAEAFLLTVTQSLAMQEEAGREENASCREMIGWSLVTSKYEEIRHFNKLWKEAELFSSHDEIMLEAFRTATKLWHTSLVELLETGIAKGEFISKRDVNSVAWDCIAFSCGLDAIFSLRLEEFGEDEYLRHADFFLKNQLDVIS